MSSSISNGGLPPKQDDEIEWEMRPGGMFVQRRDVAVGDDYDGAGSSASRGGPMIKINVSYGSSLHEVFLPAESNFRKYLLLFLRCLFACAWIWSWISVELGYWNWLGWLVRPCVSWYLKLWYVLVSHIGCVCRA